MYRICNDIHNVHAVNISFYLSYTVQHI